MIWFCNVITTDLCEKSNPKKSSNNKQSFINGVNKPFMGLFLCRDTYMIPVLIVPQILVDTKQIYLRCFLLSHLFVPLIISNDYC